MKYIVVFIEGFYYVIEVEGRVGRQVGGKVEGVVVASVSFSLITSTPISNRTISA